MGEAYLSFYLKSCRIRVFLEALRGIGCPRRVCFMISPGGGSLALSPYQKRDFNTNIYLKVDTERRGFFVSGEEDAAGNTLWYFQGG